MQVLVSECEKSNNFSFLQHDDVIAVAICNAWYNMWVGREGDIQKRFN